MSASSTSGEHQKEPNWYKLHRSENPDAIPEKQKQSNGQLQLVEIPLLANLGVKNKKSR